MPISAKPVCSVGQCKSLQKVCLFPGQIYVPCSDPGFGMHAQAVTPVTMFLRSFWQKSSFRSHLLSYCSDVIGLKSTAASNVTNSYVIGLSCIFLNVPSRGNSWLQTCKDIHILNFHPGPFNFYPFSLVRNHVVETLALCLQKWL